MSAKKTPAPAPVAAATGFDPAAMMAAMGPMAAMFQALLAQPRQPAQPDPLEVKPANVDTLDGLLDLLAAATADEGKATGALAAAKEKVGTTLAAIGKRITLDCGAGWWIAQGDTPADEAKRMGVKPETIEAGRKALDTVNARFAAMYADKGKNASAYVATYRKRMLTYAINGSNSARRADAKKSGKDAILWVNPYADKRSALEKAQESLAGLWLTLEAVEEPVDDLVKLKDKIKRLTTAEMIRKVEADRARAKARAKGKSDEDDADPALM